MKKKTLAAVLALCMLVAMASFAAASEQAEGEDEAYYFGEFEAEDLNGEEPLTDAVFAEADFTIVNFWATWCGPCVQELPHLAQIYESTEGRVQVISVLIDAGDEGAADAMRTLMDGAGATYPVLIPEGETLEMYREYITAVPTTLVVDAAGDLITWFEGSMDMEGWLELCDEMLALLDE